MTGLFGPDALSVNDVLSAYHYLGPITRGVAYRDEYGVMVFANPSSRRLPQQRWLELVRWCIVSDVANAGSRQWRNATRWLRRTYPQATTVVSYSDPSAGHSGALYRACNWRWAPTWHRLRTPPSGNGAWTTGKAQAAKDRWVFCLLPDATREGVLAIKDASVLREMPWAQYRERHGGDYRRFASLVASRGGDIRRPKASVDEVLPVRAGFVEFIQGPEASTPKAQPSVVMPLFLAEVGQVLPNEGRAGSTVGAGQVVHAPQSIARLTEVA